MEGILSQKTCKGTLKTLYQYQLLLEEMLNDWWVWKINEEQRQVGKLKGENRKAEIGSVIPPDSIVHRMQTGRYDFVYPDFE